MEDEVAGQMLAKFLDIKFHENCPLLFISCIEAEI
jgi:hypothetical protein